MILAENAHPYFAAVNWLEGSRWLLAEGDTIGAAELLTWTDAVVPYAAYVSHANAVVEGYVNYERGALEEARGRSDWAATLYKRFVERVDQPSPVYRARVEYARRIIAMQRSGEIQRHRKTYMRCVPASAETAMDGVQEATNFLAGFARALRSAACLMRYVISYSLVNTPARRQNEGFLFARYDIRTAQLGCGRVASATRWRPCAERVVRRFFWIQ